MAKKGITLTLGCLLLTLFLGDSAKGQALAAGGYPNSTEATSSRWMVTCGMDRFESGAETGIIETRSGDLVVATSTRSQGAGHLDLWILRFTPKGKIKWERTYGGSSREDTPAIRQTRDGGLIVAGVTESFGAGGPDFWVLKLRPSGKIQWQRAYGGPGLDWGYAIQETSDGGYVVAGRTESYGAGSTDYWVLKLTSSGEIEWQKAYGGSGAEFALSIQETNDSGYIVAGFTGSFGAGDRDFWILKLTPSGDIEWQHTYGGTASEWATSIATTRDGGYVVAGVTHEFSIPGITWILRLTSSGNIKWQRAYGGTFMDYPWDVKQTVDSGFIVAGYTESFGRLLDSFLLKLNPAGRVKWHRTYGDWYDETAFSVQQIRDGGFVAAGGTNSFGAGADDWDLFLLKLSRAGTLGTESELIGNPRTRVEKTRYSPVDTSVTPLVTDAVPQRTAGRSRKTKARTNVLFIGSQPLPAPPMELTASAISGNAVRLSWKDLSNLEKGFRVERKQDGGGEWKEIELVKRNKTGCQDTGLESGALYKYRVRAFNRDGFSPYSNVAEIDIRR